MTNRGFTLIELLVVIAILGILAALAIPQFSQYRGTAYCAQITSEASHAFTAMEAYYAQHLAYGLLSDTNFTPTADISVVIANTDPLVVEAFDVKARCPRGTYTLDQHRGRGTWSS
jgi:type IV pilus assembly protein PilA